MRKFKYLFSGVMVIALVVYGAWIYREVQVSRAFAGSKLKFSLVNEPIDVIIPCTEKDLRTLGLCIDGIRENGKNVRRIIVVSQIRYTDKAEWFPESRYPFSKKDLALALFEDEERAENYLSLKKNRAGWLLQQLLKLYVHQVIPGLSSNVLVLDADTIFLSPVEFVNEKGGAVFHPGLKEYHLPYFRHARRLIPGFHRLFSGYSGIAHHMLIQKSVVEGLMKEVEACQQQPFWKAFCSLINHDDIYQSGASEYEIYFNYALARTDQVSVETLKWTNTDSINNLEQFKREGYHYISAHEYLRECND